MGWLLRLFQALFRRKPRTPKGRAPVKPTPSPPIATPAPAPPTPASAAPTPAPAPEVTLDPAPQPLPEPVSPPAPSPPPSPEELPDPAALAPESETLPEPPPERPPAPPPAPAVEQRSGVVRLSPHFTLSEFTMSQTAQRKGLDNTPPPEVVANLREVAQHMEKVRALLGNTPLVITSGYRAPKVNAALGSRSTSAHVKGYAADFICPAFGTPFDICKAIESSALMSEVDQLIHEYAGWVHISFDPRRRRQVMTFYHPNGMQRGLLPLTPSGRLLS